MVTWPRSQKIVFGGHCVLGVECWLFWETMTPLPIRTGSLKLYRPRASGFYGIVPFR
jgi:hypothetical protein